MARYLVTGGAGFIGSHLVESLLDDGRKVRVLDDLSSGSRDNLPCGVEFIKADITDPEVVRSAFDDIDGCFHLAAIASVEKCNLEWLRTHQVNLSGTINIFSEARRSRGKIPVVYASTAAVYGDHDATPAREDSCATPLSAYGADKRACELHARAAGVTHGLRTVGLRFFNLYGPRQDPRSPYSGVIAIFMDRLRRGEPVDIYGEGGQVRDFVYIADAVAALRRAMPIASERAPVYNVCTGKGTKVGQLAETIAALCGTELVVTPRPPRGGEVQCSIGDPDRAAAELRFRACTALPEGLAATLDALETRGRAEACVIA
ncbi:MAG TPA: NAD-dependent epimerase/dehydratase family protein [Stellaceae bacterium]|nr:NAD-dependent epimerase/dehydratase family protein [Stellaceae bacterium]